VDHRRPKREDLVDELADLRKRKRARFGADRFQITAKKGLKKVQK
jgi:hypothetical protein